MCVREYLHECPVARVFLVSILIASLAGAFPVGGGAQAPGIPAGATPVPPAELAQWGEDLFNNYSQQATRITGDKDDQGRLLDLNGEVLPITTQVGILLTRDSVVKKLDAFADEMSQALDQLSRNEKAALGRALADKAAELRVAQAEYEQAESNFSYFLPSEIRYYNLMEEAARQDKLGFPDEAERFRTEANNLTYARFTAARDRYVGLLDATPVLGLKVDGEFMYDAFEDLEFTGDRFDDDQVHVDFLNAFVSAGIAQTRDRADELRNTWDLESLSQFSSSRYSAIHDGWTQIGQTLGMPVLVDLMAETRYASYSYFRDWLDRFWETTIDQALVVIGVGSMFLPGGQVISAVAGGIQVYRSGEDLYVAYVDAQDAVETAPATSFGTVLDAENRKWDAAETLGLDVAFFGLDAFGTVRLVRSVRADRAAARVAGGTPATMAGRDYSLPLTPTGEVIIPNRQPSTLRPLGADDVVSRLDEPYLSSFPRNQIASMPDQAFYQTHVPPRRTVDVGGQTYHVSDPFMGPGGRPTVIAYQETPAGTVVPRTWYFSGENGVWRAATGATGELIEKGPVRFDVNAGELNHEQALDALMNDQSPYRSFVNKAVVDLPGELQGPLSRWFAEVGPRQLDPNISDQAFFGHLEGSDLPWLQPEMSEFGQWVGRADISTPPTPGARQPDLSAGPVDVWTMPSAPHGGRVNGYLYPALDGEGLVVVNQNAFGNVWRGSIQAGDAPITPFGPRAWTYNPGSLADSPLTKGLSGYEPRAGFENVVDPSMLPNRPITTATGPRGTQVLDVPQMPGATRPAATPGVSPAGASPSPSTGADGARPSARDIAGRPLDRPETAAANLGRAANRLSGDAAGGDSLAGPTPRLEGLVDAARREAVDKFGGTAGDWSVFPSGPNGVLVRSEDGTEVVVATPGLDSRGQPVVRTETYVKEGRLWTHRRLLNGVWLESSSDFDTPPAPTGPVMSAPPENAEADAPPSRVGAVPAELDPSGAEVANIDVLLDTSNFVMAVDVDGDGRPDPMSDLLGHDRNDGIQAMILDTSEIFADGFESGDTASWSTGRDVRANPPPALPFATAPQGLWGKLKQWLTPAPQLWAMSSRRTTTWSGPSGGLTQPSLALAPLRFQSAEAQTARPRLETLITGLGVSSGEAMTMRIVNTGPVPVKLTGDGLVVEPLDDIAREQLDNAIKRISGMNPLTMNLDAYCLERLNLPPSLDTAFRIASSQLQQRFEPARRIMGASRELFDAGKLTPDSNPLDYFNSVRQWAIWADLEDLDEESFGDEFIKLTRKNLEDQGTPWQDEFAEALRGVVPARWRDIVQILETAAQP